MNNSCINRIPYNREQAQNIFLCGNRVFNFKSVYESNKLNEFIYNSRNIDYMYTGVVNHTYELTTCDSRVWLKQHIWD